MVRTLLLLIAVYHESYFAVELDDPLAQTASTSMSLIQVGASRYNRSAVMETSVSGALAGGTCAGGTSPGSTNWLQYTTSVIYVTIDTSVCGFTVTPNYLTSLGGTSDLWKTKGSSEVYEPTATGFKLYIYFSSVTPSYAADRDWHVNWIGHQDGKDTSPGAPATVPCAGDTGAGTTGWNQYDSNGIYTDVVTSACGFTSVPSYLSSLIGDGSTHHYLTTGSSEVYSATATGFRIYINKPGGLTTSVATNNNWHMNWIGHPSGKTINSGGGVTCAGRTAVGSTNWKQYSSDGLYVDIDTSVCDFTSAPRYVTSLGGSNSHWRVTGGSEVYNGKKDSFRIYVNSVDSITPSIANSRNMHINWMATPETSVSAIADPHMSNVVGDRFNVLRPDTYTFVEVPRGAKMGEHQLLISARVDQLFESCDTGGLYVKSMNISGKLLNDVGLVTVTLVSKEIDAMEILNVKTEQTSATSANEFARGHSDLAKFEQPNSNNQNLNFEAGGIAVRITGRRQEIQEKNKIIEFMNLRITGLSAYKDVGGLLGTDDHTVASTAPPECGVLLQNAPTSNTVGMGSRVVAN